jgi:cobalt-zinc-cadmium efflux system outer membrane protein
MHSQRAGLSALKMVLRYIAVLAGCGGLVQGQVRLTLEDAVRQALTSNPRLAGAQATIDQAEGERAQAGLGPNPRLATQSEDARFWGNQPRNFANTTEDYVFVGQVFESAGKRSRRVDVASSNVRSSGLQLDVLKRELRARVSAAYWNAAGTARLRDLLRQDVQTYEEDVAYVRARTQQGVMAQSDLMRIQVERDRVRARAMAAARDADVAIVELYRAIGRTDYPATDLVDSLEGRKAVVPPEIASVLNARPEARLARERITAAEANVSLQKANAKPDPEVFAGYKRDVGLDTLYGAVQVDLPFRNRNQGNVASSVAQVRIAKADLSYTEAEIRAQVESAERAYQDDQSMLNSMPATLTSAQETERLARAAYREGGIDLLRLMDAERNRIDVETQYYRTLMDFQQSIVNLEFASGEEK